MTNSDLTTTAPERVLLQFDECKNETSTNKIVVSSKKLNLRKNKKKSTRSSRSRSPTKSAKGGDKIDRMMADRENSLEALIKRGLGELVDSSFMAGDCGGTPSSTSMTPYLTSQANRAQNITTYRNSLDKNAKAKR